MAAPKRDLGLQRRPGRTKRANIAIAIAKWPPADRETPLELTSEWLNKQCLPRLHSTPPGLGVAVGLGGSGHAARQPASTGGVVRPDGERQLEHAEWLARFYRDGDRERIAAEVFREFLAYCKRSAFTLGLELDDYR